MSAKVNPQNFRFPIVDKQGVATKDFLDFLYRIWARSGAADGVILISAGGTGADNVTQAQINLQLEPGVDVQVYDADLDALAGLATAADKVPYFTGAATAALADFTSYGRTLVATTSEANFKATVNLEIGVDVQAYSANLDEAAIFFGATNITGSEAETLTNGNNADLLHVHAHNVTTGLQGGTASEYYHLTAIQHSTLTDGSNADSLHRHDRYQRKLSINTTAVGNVGTGEDDLITYSMPANTLASNGNGIRITAWGNVNHNGTNIVRLYFGTQLLEEITISGTSDHRWRAVATVWRTGTSAQVFEAQMNEHNGGSSSSAVDNGTATEDETAIIIIKCTGDALNDNDIVQKGLMVELIP